MASRWSERDDVLRGDDYDARWRALAASGESVHGEADLVSSFSPATVLDGGCGTGRVAIELGRRGVEVVGVDLDAGMLDSARVKAPDLEWVLADLAAVDLDRQFDVVCMPGNVMIFVSPGTEAQVLANMTRHTNVGGLVIAGFQLGPDRLSLIDYDAYCGESDLEMVDRFATWDQQPFVVGCDYAVSVHRRVS